MRKLFLIIILLIGGMMTSNPSQPIPYSDGIENTSIFSFGDEIVACAQRYIGTPYKWGATGPKSFDCSGFMKWVYGKMGINISRTSRQQYFDGSPVKRTELRAGDLVFFARNKKSHKSIYHVGMVVDADSSGGYSFIHSARGGVKISPSHKYERNFFGAVRIV